MTAPSPYVLACHVRSRLLKLGGAIILISTISLQAQMVPGARVIGETPVLGLDRDHKSPDFAVQQISASVPGNVLLPGDEATLKLHVTNLTKEPLSGEGKIKVFHYGTRGKPGDIWEPEFFSMGEVDSIPFQVKELAAQASTEIEVMPKIPATYGGYLLVAELAGHGQTFAASVVRSLSPDGGAVQYPAYALDLEGTSDEVARFFKRLGVKGARAEINVFGPEDKDYAKKWDRIVQLCKTLQENEITLMVTTASGTLPMPLDRARPHLDDEDTFKETKSDLAWLPSADDEFEKWVQKICGTFGWPKGPINAVELWNEPWEGISISGWGADMLRYREIYAAMAKGIEAARAQDGVDVLMGGCGSSSNTVDKFFSDGSDTFLKWLDFCSIHYQTMAATPALMKNFINRKEGPVRVWDTESWVANSEDRVGLVVASMHAMGQERAMGVYAGNVYQPQNVTLVDGQKSTVVQAWSPAAAVGASTKFVGQRPFRELLFQNGLPWVFVFDGRPGESADDGTVVVAGDLGGCYSRNLLLFRSVYGLENQKSIAELKKALAELPASASAAEHKALQTQLDGAMILQGGSMTIADPAGQFVLTDFYGNEVPAKDGQIVVPLNGYGYYLRTKGQAGSFAKLLDALRNGKVEGYQPIEIIAHDLTAPLGSEPTLKLTLTNVLNRPVTGKLTATLGTVELAVNQEVKLAPNETKEVGVKVSGVASVPENSYPLQVRFDAGADGSASHDEAIHANVIAKRSIAVDGKLDDWTGVIPQTLTAEGIGANMTEKAWLPFSKFDDSITKGVATGYLAYDDQNFYFAARISDSTPDAGMVRFETRDDDEYFYPAVSKRYDESGTFVKIDKPVENPRFREQALKLPKGDGRSQTVWESVSNALAFNLSLPTTELHQVALYLLSWDPLGRHNVNIEISDAKTGKVLDRRDVKDFGDGKYIVYDLAGDLRVKISTKTWLKGVLSGVFIDKSKEKGNENGATAKFLAIDEYTHGNWAGIYGAEGNAIAGTLADLPSFAKMVFSDEVKKEELRWPEGVRRFSYRKRPDLPAGYPESHDNVQLAFNVLPPSEKPWLPSPPGTPSRWMMYYDTDYEYALNEVASKYGAGTEIWRLQTPGMPTKHFYPRQPKSPFDGAVKDGKLVMRRDGNMRIVEVALPWSEIPGVKKSLDAGENIKFSFRINDNGGTSYELATERSVSKANSTTFHNNWQTHWSNEVEFGFQK